MLKPTISLFIICAVVTAALALTYVGTKDTIARRTFEDMQRAMREVFPAAESFEEIEDISAIIASRPDLNIVKGAYRGLKSETMLGYVFTVANRGYGGDIWLTVGIDKEGKITGVKAGDNAETPNLGTKALESPFLSQFINVAPQEPFKVVKGQKTKPEEIDAVSGATVSSKAVIGAVQAAVDMAAILENKGGN